MTEIRRALGDDDQKAIRTVPRRGYRFAAPLITPVREFPRALPPDNVRAPAVTTGRPFLQRRLGLAAGLIGVLVAAVFVGRELGLSTDNGDASALREPPFVSPVATNTLAVLPFRLLDSSDEDQVLGIGMADSLITRLGLLRDLLVRPLPSVQLYADGSKDPLTAGRELTAQSVLEGTLQQDGDRIRVRVRLYRVSDGRLLWAEQFDEPYRDLFALQDSISQQVAMALSLELGQKLQQAVDPIAWENYVRGRYFFDQWTREGSEKALAYFAKAVEIQPDFALAHAELAINYAVMLERGFISAADADEKLSRAAERALTLDDSLAEAHDAMAGVHYHAFEWAAAERAFRRAIELNPSRLHTWGAYTYVLSLQGRTEEALELSRRALEIDPVSDYASKARADTLMRAGRFEEALEQIDRALELRPDFGPARWVLAETYMRMGRQDDALREFEAAGFAVEAAYIQALQGDRVPAVRLVEELRNVPRAGVYRAMLQTVLGDTDGALSSLEKGFEERATGLKQLKSTSRLAPLRGEPRFQQLLARMNL
jgi:TolB-like protein/Flp pilus assembly protein TadD